MTSPGAVLVKGAPDPGIVKMLRAIAGKGHPVGLVSNHAKPAWFDASFAGSYVQFLQQIGRQSGKVVSVNTAHFKLKPYDALVLAGTNEDVQMGKNGEAVLIAAGWSDVPQVRSLGIRVNDASELGAMIDLTENWQGHWWFSMDNSEYRVRALADLSQYNKPVSQQEFSAKLTTTVKKGGPHLTALLAVTARSLLMDGSQPNLLWGVYPSSHSDNQDAEVLSDFTHRLRTTVSRVQYCKKGEPLFIRHTPSLKRSAGGASRLDPSNQLLTMHLNPIYKGSALRGKNVIVVDDCTTYGASFGVASAFLHKAGAASVTGVALGKFGSQMHEFDISITGDPFAPLSSAGFAFQTPAPAVGKTSGVTQQILLKLIP
jgi:hypothetical protein